MQYTTVHGLVHPSKNPQDPDLILAITPDSAGWDLISFQARRLGEMTDFGQPQGSGLNKERQEAAVSSIDI